LHGIAGEWHSKALGKRVGDAPVPTGPLMRPMGAGDTFAFPPTVGMKHMHPWRSSVAAAFLLLLMVAAMPVQAQRFQVVLSGKVTDMYSGDPLRGVLVRVLKAGQEDQQRITKGDGRYRFELERGWKYEVWFSKKHMVAKHVIVDTREIPPYPDVPFYEMDLQMTLFPWMQGVDLEAFQEAVGLAAYKESVRNMSWDTPYTNQMRPVLSKTMDEYEKTYRGYYERRDRREKEVYR